MDIDLKALGAAAGAIALLRLLAKDVVDIFRFSRRRPRLKLLFAVDTDVREFKLREGQVRKFGNLRVINRGRGVGQRCVATAQLLGTQSSRKFSLHWAGEPHSTDGGTVCPVEIGSEEKRLDLVFTDQDQKVTGCWLAIPEALTGKLESGDAHLEPGEYRVEVNVSCDRGAGDTMCLLVTSPEHWRRLDVRQD